MRKSFLCVVATGCALALGACQPVGPAAVAPTPSVAFNADEAAFIRKPGQSVIKGHAFLKRQNGVVVPAAGEVVRLIPSTAYSRDRIARFYGGKNFIPAIAIPKAEADPAYSAYTRTTLAESNGRFSFDKVAAGTYFITTQQIWTERGRYLPSGGAMVQTVTVNGKDGDPVEVILSGN